MAFKYGRDKTHRIRRATVLSKKILEVSLLWILFRTQENHCFCKGDECEGNGGGDRGQKPDAVTLLPSNAEALIR